MSLSPKTPKFQIEITDDSGMVLALLLKKTRRPQNGDGDDPGP